VNPQKDRKTGIYKFLKRFFFLNTQQGNKPTDASSTNKHAYSEARQVIPADFQLPGTQVCESCKVAKGTYTFEELYLLQETCERRNSDGHQCIVPVLVDEPIMLQSALESELRSVVPSALLKARRSRYILVRCDLRAESTSQPVYTQVEYDWISRLPSRSNSWSRPDDDTRFDYNWRTSRSPSRASSPSLRQHRVSNEAMLYAKPAWRAVNKMSLRRSRMASRSLSPVDRGRPTAEISGAHETKSSAATGGVLKLS